VDYSQQVSDTSIPLDINDNDKAAFEDLLKKIQHSWSEGELGKLRQFVTPEMLQYFSEEMSANASRGLINKVENVNLESAEVVESWREFELDYATVRLEWSALDYMVSLDKSPRDDGYVVSGSNGNTQSAEEFWTFARTSGGNWLLSAIQQVN
jgi:predicted lipid-binding transport protein (Tim44 family)